MKRSRVILAVVSIVMLLAPVLNACAVPPTVGAINYLVLAPQVLRSGETEAISVSLLQSDKLTSGTVNLSLLDSSGNAVAGVQGTVKGKGELQLKVPAVPDGSYQLKVSGAGFQDQAQVKIEQGALLFLETDKPIYKPGQTIHIRVLSLDSALKPMPSGLSVEVMDAKGIKVFRKDVQTDDYGMADLELPLSTEPNLGVWKLSAKGQNRSTQLDVRVEEYVLPKYQVTVDMPKEWFLASEAISGKVKADYSFGKPVKGQLEIKAQRYVGQWQDYASLTKDIDGETTFDLPAVQYVAGVPAAGGNGNVMLTFTVTEPATGYQEKTTKLLTVAATPLNIQIIPDSPTFKPSLPFGLLLITQTPDNKPQQATVNVKVTYYDKDLKEARTETRTVLTSGGKALVSLQPPQGAVALTLLATSGNSQATKSVAASYSPSGNFIHLEQTSSGTPKVGDEVRFRVYSTSEAVNFYYEVVSRGKVVFSDFTKQNQIAITATPLMAPSSRLLVYQVLPNSEVAADYLPFAVNAQYPQDVNVDFSRNEVKPGEQVAIDVQTQGPARVGLVAVDKSVYMLAENRLNLQQVFDQLEELYMKPQAELHSVTFQVPTMGAKEVFDQTGMVVMSNRNVPAGKQYTNPAAIRNGPGGPPGMAGPAGVMEKAAAPMGTPSPAPAPTAPPATDHSNAVLADVQRVRQFFPETWLWQTLTTDSRGRGSVNVQAPDTITTWMLRAVALSKDKGLGIGEAQLRAFQPFFLSLDLPYSSIRGEQFPVKVSIYNYLTTKQSVQVEIKPADWFDLKDAATKTLDIAGNDIGGASFTIKPTKLGTHQIEVTVRSQAAADAVAKSIIVEPEGVSRETVANLILAAGDSKTVSTTVPETAVAGSGRAYIAVTGSYLAQTINGLDGLLQMPFGCGEQNMILFAPDVFITKYLERTGQLKPEVMAKAEKLMITGYQRELTYMRNDGSFSAFGNSDKEGSLWLTSFVLKTFAQAKGTIYIDDAVLNGATRFIVQHQSPDGSFDTVGFVVHQDMMGGVKGKTAMTAYVTLALLESGEKAASAKAVAYLEGQLSGIDDAYTATLVAYALEKAGSPKKGQAYDKLMKLAQADENGLHWGSDVQPLQPTPVPGGRAAPIMPFRPNIIRSTDIEATGYATLALIEHGDVLSASRAARWLVVHRNSQGGFGSTQDTVVALQALTSYAAGAAADVDLKLTIDDGTSPKVLSINKGNFDVLQMVEVSTNKDIKVSAQGKGQAVVQGVTRFNLPQPEAADQPIHMKVDYSTTQVEVNDLVDVKVEVGLSPQLPVDTGMVVLDVSVPTGFAPVKASIDKAVAGQKLIKRYDVAGRKVIFYLDELRPGENVTFQFQVQALYPVRAQAVASQAYSYYKPEIKGETVGQAITVAGQ